MFIIDKVRGWLLSIGIFIAVAGGIWLRGFTSGKNSEKDKQVKVDEKSKKVREEISDEVENLSNGQLDERLSKWVRKP